MRIKREDCWKHRGSDMRCATCMWYVQKQKMEVVPEYTFEHGTNAYDKTCDVVKTENVILGRCRKNAPTMEGYPVVYPGDWCGQHKLDENKLDENKI